MPFYRDKLNVWDIKHVKIYEKNVLRFDIKPKEFQFILNVVNCSYSVANVYMFKPDGKMLIFSVFIFTWNLNYQQNNNNSNNTEKKNENNLVIGHQYFVWLLWRTTNKSGRNMFIFTHIQHNMTQSHAKLFMQFVVGCVHFGANKSVAISTSETGS